MLRNKRILNVRILVLSILTLILISSSVSATEIFGPTQITATTSIPNSGAGFTIDQICDGIIDPDVWFNGFAAVPGMVGTIRLDLTTASDLQNFILWNDINVLAEGIADFRLEFFDAGDVSLGSTEVFTGPVGSQEPVVYYFDQVNDVKRVDLVVVSLNVNQRLEIREVGFNEGEIVATEGTTWSLLKSMFR